MSDFRNIVVSINTIWRNMHLYSSFIYRQLNDTESVVKFLKSFISYSYHQLFYRLSFNGSLFSEKCDEGSLQTLRHDVEIRGIKYRCDYNPK